MVSGGTVASSRRYFVDDFGFQQEDVFTVQKTWRLFSICEQEQVYETLGILTGIVALFELLTQRLYANFLSASRKIPPATRRDLHQNVQYRDLKTETTSNGDNDI